VAHADLYRLLVQHCSMQHTFRHAGTGHDTGHIDMQNNGMQHSDTSYNENKKKCDNHLQQSKLQQVYL